MAPIETGEKSTAIPAAQKPLQELDVADRIVTCDAMHGQKKPPKPRRRRGISVATVRAQLSSIFEKTGTHRQAELVHLLLEIADKRDPGKWEV